MVETERAGSPRLVLEEGEWRVPPEAQTNAILEALSNQVRREIFRQLERPMRKYEIARFVHERFGRKYSRSLIEHHLKLLEQAGLIAYGGTPEARLVHRVADVRIQLRPKQGPPTGLAERLRRLRGVG